MGTATDDGYPVGGSLSISWTKISGDGNVTFSNPNSLKTSAQFSVSGVYVLRLTATDGQLSTSDDITITVHPENLAPIVNAGANQTIELPNSAALSGTATDDGLPAGSSMIFAWSKISGEGDVVFSSQNSLTTTASFSQSGTYLLRLNVSDGQLYTSDELTVTVNPENHAPIVGAGADQTVILPNSTVLNGTATDDGLPSGSALVTTWSKVSGSGTVTFSNANSAVTTASFDQAGTYILRLSATDGALSATDELTVIVAQANQPPVVSAGNDQTVILPNTAVLNGIVTDDGLPEVSSVSTTWSKLSGPGVVTFADPLSPNTTAAFSLEGTYELKLEATDGEFTASDIIIVSVQPNVNGPTANYSIPSIGGPMEMSVVSFSSASSTLSSPSAQRFRFQQTNQSSSYMVKDFVLQVSMTTSDDSAFSTVLTGTLQANDQLQEFTLPGDAVFARFVKLVAVNLHGSGSQITLGTFQVVGAGTADNIVSLPGTVNVATNASPSIGKQRTDYLSVRSGREQAESQFECFSDSESELDLRCQ